MSGRVKKKVRNPKKTRRKKGSFSIRSMMFYLFLLSFLTLSVSVLGYVIFFRTVAAAEIEVLMGKDVQFEEPALPEHEYTHQEKTVGIESETSRVAIIIDDMGYHPEIGKALLASGLPLSFSFLPHAPFTQELEEQAYQAGNTVLLHLPMEPKGDEWDPGPGALTLGQTIETSRKLMEQNLAKVPHATGVNNHMGSRYTESRKEMKEVVFYLKERDLFFIDSYTTPDSVGFEIASKENLKTARRHVFLDNVQNVEKICAQIKRLVEISKKQHYAIGIAHPYPETLQAINSCAKESLKDVEIVSIAELVN